MAMQTLEPKIFIENKALFEHLFVFGCAITALIAEHKCQQQIVGHVITSTHWFLKLLNIKQIETKEITRE